MIIRPESKTDLPKNIQRDMKLWRMGLGGLPLDYIKFHIALAKKERSRLTSEYNLNFRENALVSDGWLDGMRVMERSRASGDEPRLPTTTQNDIPEGA